jgi:biopolymer transport protein ExbB/TolQ
MVEWISVPIAILALLIACYLYRRVRELERDFETFLEHHR